MPHNSVIKGEQKKTGQSLFVILPMFLIRVSQCAKSMKNYTLNPDSRLSCQVHYKKAKIFSFNANLGVPHDCSII